MQQDSTPATSTENSWMEVSCQRSVSGSEYGRGLQDYIWSVSAPSVWFPSRSYFRYELELYGPGDPTTSNPPKVSDGLAFAENCVSNSITNAYMYSGGQVVSSIVNSYAQCASVAYRSGKTAAWMKNQGTAYAQHGTLSERIAAVSSTTSGGAPIGLSGLDDNREEIYKPCAQSNAATIQVTAGPILVSGSTASGTATAFANGAVDAGVKIVAGGVTYTIASVATDGAGIQTITVILDVAPLLAVAATTDWYAIRRTTRRSDQARHKIQVLYQPPLGIFAVSQPMGSGSYKLSLSPDPSFRLSMVETKDPGYALTGADTRYRVVVKDVKLYVATGKLSIPLNEIVQLDLLEYAAYSKVMSAASENLQFTIPASTETIYVSLQHPSAGSNPAWPPNKFVANRDSDLNLQSLQITYANQTKTMTRWTSSFKAGTNQLVQLYNMSLQETHRDESSGGAESFNQWLDRGPLYAFKFDRDASARDTEMTVQISYNDAEAGAFDPQSKLFIIAEYRRLVELTHSNGSIVSVIARDV